MTYFHRIMLMSFWVVMLHVYLQCITICHYVIFQFWVLLNQSTDLLQILCGCFQEGSLPRFSKSGCYPFFSMELWVILCNFWSILKNSFSIRLLTRNHSYIWFGSLQMTLFLDYLWSIFTLSRYLILDYPLNRCTYLLQIWCGCFLGGPLPDLFKIRVLPYFQWNYW